MTAPRFSDPTLEGIADEFIEVVRVKHDAEAKLVELFNTKCSKCMDRLFAILGTFFPEFIHNIHQS